jgi:hypothetical protein
MPEEYKLKQTTSPYQEYKGWNINDEPDCNLYDWDDEIYDNRVEIKVYKKDSMMSKIFQKLAYYVFLICLTSGISTLGLTGMTKIYEAQDNLKEQYRYSRASDFATGLTLLSASGTLGLVLISSIFVTEKED